MTTSYDLVLFYVRTLVSSLWSRRVRCCVQKPEGRPFHFFAASVFPSFFESWEISPPLSSCCRWDYCSFRLQKFFGSWTSFRFSQFQYDVPPIRRVALNYLVECHGLSLSPKLVCLYFASNPCSYPLFTLGPLPVKPLLPWHDFLFR